jgi:serine/threonine protein kinase
MRYIHSKGFIHRDLKPSNILIDGSDHDVRIERTFSQNVRTAQYMAPELYEISQDDEGHYGPDPTEKIDVF